MSNMSFSVSFQLRIFYDLVIIYEVSRKRKANISEVQLTIACAVPLKD